jgi:hypothetical protein
VLLPGTTPTQPPTTAPPPPGPPPTPPFPPPTGAVAIVGVDAGFTRITFDLSCLRGGTVTIWQTLGTGKGNLGHAPFACTKGRSSVWLTPNRYQRPLLLSDVGLHLRLKLVSGSHTSNVPVVIRKRTPTPPRQTQTRARAADATNYCDGSASHAVNSGTPGFTQITAGPSGWSRLAGKNWGDPTAWRAWLYWYNPQTKQGGWIPDPSPTQTGWKYYTVLANGASQSGAYIYDSVHNNNLWAFVGGVTAPGVDPLTSVFTVPAGYYYWPWLESWSNGNHYWCWSHIASWQGATFVPENWIWTTY